ncbi:GTPase-associated protein 1-related protein [Streptomyces sp. NBC_00005]|uniref:GTPase-associated protein 1-related protein n=1 Tax=Streptomyces sp. NBC_00005 TaxID=2903609 RepID=UPI0032473FC3
MAIRELSYVLLRDPDSGADRLTPVTAVPDGVPDDLMQRIITATHGAAPASGAALSYTRLPHREGGGLLCSARLDEDSERLRVDARYEAGDPDGTRRRWPVDAWRPSALAARGDEAFAPEDRLWDDALLVKFASDQGRRVAPFLADVRGLFADPAGRQIVVAEQDQETVARWIALACASLPVAYARALTFTTHSADPGAAPQQILGIDPDTDPEVFDRKDLPTITHLFRVHDGLGGPGSPPLADSWAEAAAWLWREGVVPRPGGPEEGTADGSGAFGSAGDAEGRDGSGGSRDSGLSPGAAAAGQAPAPQPPAPQDPFALLPLVRRALTARSDDAFEALPDGSLLSEILTAATRAAEQGPLDDALARDLAEIARRIATHRRDAVQPLVAALLRRQAKAAHPQDVVPALEAARGELPLDDGTWRTVRSEFGPPPEDELRRLLRQPPSPAWEKPLRALLTPGADRGSTVDEAVLGLARALSRPDDRQPCADAVALLAALGDRVFTRRVLNRLAEGAEGRRIGAIRDLAASPHGVWLRDHLDGAPFVVRIAASAANLGGAPYGRTGVELWAELAKLHLDGQVSDVPTLKILWALAWPEKSGVPPKHEQGRVTDVCPARLIVEAGWESRLSHWLRHPGRVTQEYFDFARAVSGSRRLAPSEQALAQLLVLARDFARGEETVGPFMERLPVLERDAGRLDEVVRDRIDCWIARGMARTEPAELYRTHALHYVATGSLGLIHEYGKAVRHAQRQGGTLEPAALRDPSRLAALFVIWGQPHRGARGRWRDLSNELLYEVLGAVVQHLDERDLSTVATVLSKVDKWWVQTWNDWRNGRR